MLLSAGGTDPSAEARWCQVLHLLVLRSLDPPGCGLVVQCSQVLPTEEKSFAVMQNICDFTGSAENVCV